VSGRELILVDGPPGTGCPAISALTGADLALVVTEPTPSGESDLQRVLALIRHFGIAAAVLVNKADLHPRAAERLADRVAEEGIPVVGSFPYDDAVSQAIRDGRPLSSCSDGWRERFKSLWLALSSVLDGLEDGVAGGRAAETEFLVAEKETGHEQ
jgi:MinD superfamily P-loop ATPase